MAAALMAGAATQAGAAAELGESPFSVAPKARGSARALAVANEAFARQLPAAGPHSSAIDRFVSDPDNYAIAVDRDGANYTVEYAIKPFEGRRFRGGGYRYTIDGDSYRIVDSRIDP
ncbi:hypothetical protein J5226_17765 [Lysobacter sp. K5869]|uniref:hypothetical protein n=1 Tax=Lysobacter sp. K5869 TaxID=2820808 RepID=UPI001C064583|nr:hypothetical protein [Lysobacter sp. K5869]QWP75450.1 hypothetical protein J5226_17765 [Lysobacter sp. K5869]